jgi:hypothetical protein
LGQRGPGAQYIRADIVGKKWEAYHVLKFGVLANFLHPLMNDGGFLKRVRGYLTPFMKRCWITGPIKTIQDAVSFFIQLDNIGEWDNIKVGRLEW